MAPRAPAFWANPPARPGLLARLLAPLAWAWTLATRRRMARGAGVRLGVPVVCVGNLTAGGAGKTPTVIALVERLAARGVAAHVVSRGHGGSLAGPVRVDERRHTAAEVGDEPLLLAAFGPVWVGRDRAAAARAAVAAGAQAVVMDDGLQNPGLAKDLSIVVVDAGFGFGNGRVMPAGPLREPVAEGLARADLVLAVGSAEERARFAGRWPAARPLVEGALVPLATGMDWRGLRAVAFAGIGRPEKFFATLRAEGAELVAAHGFGDHEPFDARILARLEAEAVAARAQLVTTEKDAVRLPAAFRPKVLVLPVRMDLADWGPVDAALARLRL
jgi:tetraacyldisaccharide 4'-kinase